MNSMVYQLHHRIIKSNQTIVCLIQLLVSSTMFLTTTMPSWFSKGLSMQSSRAQSRLFVTCVCWGKQMLNTAVLWF